MKAFSIRTFALAASSLVLTTVLMVTPAQAKVDYHIYIKDGQCQIDKRTPDAWKKVQGPDWKYVGKENSKSAAKKKTKLIGCD